MVEYVNSVEFLEKESKAQYFYHTDYICLERVFLCFVKISHETAAHLAVLIPYDSKGKFYIYYYLPSCEKKRDIERWRERITYIITYGSS